MRLLKRFASIDVAGAEDYLAKPLLSMNQEHIFVQRAHALAKIIGGAVSEIVGGKIAVSKLKSMIVIDALIRTYNDSTGINTNHRDLLKEYLNTIPMLDFIASKDIYILQPAERSAAEGKNRNTTNLFNL